MDEHDLRPTTEHPGTDPFVAHRYGFNLVGANVRAKRHELLQGPDFARLHRDSRRCRAGTPLLTKLRCGNGERRHGSAVIFKLGTA